MSKSHIDPSGHATFNTFISDVKKAKLPYQVRTYTDGLVKSIKHGDYTLFLSKDIKIMKSKLKNKAIKDRLMSLTIKANDERENLFYLNEVADDTGLL